MTRVADLIGTELDYWVAKANGDDPDNKWYRTRDSDGMQIVEYLSREQAEKKCRHGWSVTRYIANYSTRWGDGGPIIERDHIKLDGRDRNGRPIGEWAAKMGTPRVWFGPLP